MFSWLLLMAATPSSMSSYSSLLSSSLLLVEITVLIEFPPLVLGSELTVQERLSLSLATVRIRGGGLLTTRSARCGGRDLGEEGRAVAVLTVFTEDTEELGPDTLDSITGALGSEMEELGENRRSDIEENLTGAGGEPGTTAQACGCAPDPLLLTTIFIINSENI